MWGLDQRLPVAQNPTGSTGPIVGVKGVGRAGDSGLSKGGAGQGDTGLSKGDISHQQVFSFSNSGDI